MNQNTKDWIKLIAQVLGLGGAVVVTSVLGGLTAWLAVLQGLAVAGAGVFQSLSAPPAKPGEAMDGEPFIKAKTPTN